MRALHGLWMFSALASLAACTVTVSNGGTSGDWDLDDTGPVGNADAGVFYQPDVAAADTWTAVPDTGAVDSTTVPVDVGPSVGGGVLIRAADLVNPNATADSIEIRALGFGARRADIADYKIAYAVASVGELSTSPFGVDSQGQYEVARLSGLAVGQPQTIVVRGYLRGTNTVIDALGNTRTEPVQWASTQCTATPSATEDVVATCSPLVGPDSSTGFGGVLVTADVFSPTFCASLAPGAFVELRARTPFSGLALLTRTTDECGGVLWFPASEIAPLESVGVSQFNVSVEVVDPASGASNTCVRTSACVSDRSQTAIRFLDTQSSPACGLDAASTTPSNCF